MPERFLTQSTVAAYSSICAALASLLLLAFWPAYDGLSVSPDGAFSYARAGVLVGVLAVVLAASTWLLVNAMQTGGMRRRMNEAALERATEMGALAAGLAHEIRNPLHAIQLNLHTLRRAEKRQQPLDSSELNMLFDQSIAEIGRIEQLMKQLVDFATPEEPRDEVIDATAEINSVLTFLDQEMMRNHIEVIRQISPEPIRVRMDHGRLRQLMLNLLQNARQALSEGGTVTVAVERIRQHLQIVVADDGPNVPASARARMFEPFYSTKQNGTGLGLPLVKRFVEEADGHIQYEENPAGGATFRITLPVARQNQPPKGRIS